MGFTTPIDFIDAWTVVGKPIGSHPRLPFSLEDLSDQMRRSGVVRALVARCDWSGVDSYQANLELSTSLPNYCSAIWMVHPGDAGDFPREEALLEKMASYRVGAALLQPRSLIWDPFSASAARLFDALAKGGWPVYAPLSKEFKAEDLASLVKRHPKVKWVALHGSWTRQRELCALVLNHPNLKITIDAYQANRGLEHLIAQGAESQILFGSGAPHLEMGAAKAMIDLLDAAPSVREKLASGNLLDLLLHKPSGELPIESPTDPLLAALREGAPMPCEILDAHAHILDDGQNNGGNQVMLQGDAAGMLEMADRMGVDQIGVMTWRGIQGPHQDEGHVPVIKAVDRFPDRFWGLATIHVSDKPDTEKVAELKEVCRGRRVLGIKPYPTLGLPYDHPRFAALWRYAEESGLYVGMHPFHWYEPGEFVSLATRYPKLKILAYHAGASYDIADTVISLCRNFENIYAEVNYSTVTGGVIRYLVDGCGAGRVVYGTDQPMRDPRPQLGWVVYSDLPEKTKEQILAGNIRRFLPSISPSSAVHPSANQTEIGAYA